MFYKSKYFQQKATNTYLCPFFNFHCQVRKNKVNIIALFLHNQLHPLSPSLHHTLTNIFSYLFVLVYKLYLDTRNARPRKHFICNNFLRSKYCILRTRGVQYIVCPSWKQLKKTNLKIKSAAKLKIQTDHANMTCLLIEN